MVSNLNLKFIFTHLDFEKLNQDPALNINPYAAAG